MGIVKALFLIPMLVRLITRMEELITGAKRGQFKKELVMEVFLLLLDSLVSFGLLPSNDAKPLRDNLSPMIDDIVASLNRHGVFTAAAPSAAVRLP